MGENEYGKSSDLYIFNSLKYLMMLLKKKSSGVHFYTMTHTVRVCRAMQLSFFSSNGNIKQCC